MQSQVYLDYKNKISKKGFEHIWRGESWNYILPEAIEYVKSKEYKTKIRAYANSQTRQNKDFTKFYQEIQEEKMKGKKRLEVYEKYKEKYSLSGFNKIWYGYNKTK